MPAIDTVQNTNIRPQRKVRVRTKSKPAPRPAPKPQPKVRTKAYTLPKSFKTEGNVSQGHKVDRQTQRQIDQNAQDVKQRVRKRDAQVQSKARARFGVKGQQQAVNRVRSSLAELAASDPAAYAKKLQDAKDAKRNPVIKATSGAGHAVESGLGKAARAFQEALPSYHTGKERKAGIGVSPALKETADIVATTPTSAYMTAAAVKEAAQGRPQRAEKLWKDFKDTSALPPLVTGHIGEAAKRAKERPVGTALELSGARALIGRGAGAAMRTGALGKAAKAAASTERENLRLLNAHPGEGPEVARRFSKDVFEKYTQVRSDRRRAKKGENPNVARQPRKMDLGAGEQRIAPSIGPLKHRLDDRVDRHVHAAHVMQQQAMSQAAKKAKKRAKNPPPEVKPSAASLVKPITARNPRVNGIDPGALAKQAHDVLGISKPVVLKLMSGERVRQLTHQLGKEPRGYTSVRGDHYRIEVNPNHPGNKGPRGLSNVVHYELGRVQGEEKGLVGPGEIGSRNPAYHKNANTEHAKQVMRQHIGTDLRNAPVELPSQMHVPGPEPSRIDVARQRAAQGAQHTSMVRAVRDFSIKIGPKGHVSEYRDAVNAAEHASARLGEKMVPVNIERLTRMPKDPLEYGNKPISGVRLATSRERAWRDATDNHQNGKWALMPERVVARFLDEAVGSGKHGALQKTTNQFKDVVLTTSNPVRWLGGNVTDLGMRSVMEGLTPADLYRGARVYKELGKYGRRGQMTKASTMGGGFGHLARDVSTELSSPATRLPAKIWGKYRAGVYGLESTIESLPQMAVVGKELRTGAHGRGSGVKLNQGLKGLLRATDEQVQHFAKNMVTDPATEMRIAGHVEDVIGKWGKLSPEARRALAFAPFAQWLGAATKYVLITLPVKHPIKTSIMAGLTQMTEEERKRLGFSRFLPLDKQAQDYQMMVLPQKVGKDKYGPTVKGTDVARALSFGTVNDALGFNVGGFLLPQFSGALSAAAGSSWTGEPLVYPEGHPQAGMPLSVEDRRKVALGMLIETMVPGTSAFRRVVMEKGRPSLPQSTILTPGVRTKYNPNTKQQETPAGSTGAGLKRMIGWPIPGLPSPKKVYTKGAVHRIESNKTAIREVKRWNAERSRKTKGPKDPYTGRSPVAPTPTPASDIDPYTGKPRKK